MAQKNMRAKMPATAFGGSTMRMKRNKAMILSSKTLLSERKLMTVTVVWARCRRIHLVESSGIERLQAAGEILDELFAVVETTLAKHGHQSTVLGEIQTQQQQQLRLFTDSILATQEAEFTTEGSQSLMLLIDRWRDDLVAHLKSLLEKQDQTA